MTCLEKLKMERPEMVSSAESGGAKGCPWMYGYLPPYQDCAPGNCDACWNREIPEAPVSGQKLGIPLDDISESHIKDSGDRTLFDTGAVRDMREGKGRCDLMPLEVVGEITMNPIIECIAGFQNTGKTQCLYNALWLFADRAYCDQTDENRTSTQNYATMLLEVAKHFEEGAKKYGENNWQKGIPVHCYIDSAIRHYLKWRRGDKDEPHDRAFVWNIMCCIWEVDYRVKKEES
jgi:hypothetical protein